MESEKTRFTYNGEYYIGEIKMVTPELYTPPEPEEKTMTIEEVKEKPEIVEPEPEVVMVEEPKIVEPEPEVVIVEEPKRVMPPPMPESMGEEPKNIYPPPIQEPTVVIVEEPPKPESTVVKVEELKIVPDKREKNELGVDKTTKIHLLTFEIIRVRVSPYQSATIDIVIKTDKHELERTILLTGSDYTKWSSNDDYLYDYVRENIDKIY